ncbi:MAG: glutamate-cysteine ligase family protein, partial [Sciscionella sp.]
MAAIREISATETSAWKFTDRANAEAYVASVCFKHGPPELIGIELEWTVHHLDDLRRELTTSQLADALGPYAPITLSQHSPANALPRGSLVTVEPGGQVEISVPPQPSLAALFANTAADAATLHELLLEARLVPGANGCDPHRRPHRLLHTPRYSAMAAAFEPFGVDGITMMCSTAGIQVCLDVGRPEQASARWAALHVLGPVLCAAYANSPRLGGLTTGWASARQRTLFGTAPHRMRPGAIAADPAAMWARRALDTPVICVRREGGCWEPPTKMTFAQWIDGALDTRPTTEDMDYHLSTLFPPVRPRGYYEVRYLDTQPDDEWMAPAALLAAVMATDRTVDAVSEAAAPAAGRWLHAARHGLADPRLADAAHRVAE